MKKTATLLILAFILSSCCKGRFITCDHYHSIGIGSTVEELVGCVGEPYETCEHEDGEIEYTYIEKVQLTPRLIEERDYHFYIRDGVIVNKEIGEVDQAWDYYITDDKYDRF